MATNSDKESLEALLTILDQSELVSTAEVDLGEEEEEEEEEGEGVWLGHTSSLSPSAAEQERSICSQSELCKALFTWLFEPYLAIYQAWICTHTHTHTHTHACAI